MRPEVAVLASLPAGPELCAALACIDISKVSGYEMVLVLRARARQGNYERGMFLAAVAETIRPRSEWKIAFGSIRPRLYARPTALQTSSARIAWRPAPPSG